MAVGDNPTVFSGTAGTAIVVAADQITVFGGAALAQLMKITDGAEGGTAGAPVDAAAGLSVFQTNSGTVSVSNASLAVTAASLPLPSGAATLAGQTQPGVDIGDVTVNNAAGAAAVNIQDGGNSITVDGAISVNTGTVVGTVTVANTSLAVTQSTSPWVTSATISNTGTVTGTVVLAAGANAVGKLAANDGVDIGDVTINNSTGGAAVNIQDGGNSITIDGAVSMNTGTVVGTVTATPTGTYTTKETRSSTSTVVGVAAATSSGTILVSNANRLAATVYNASTALMQMSLAGTASNSAGLYTAQLFANAYYEVPGNYTGIITANWAAASGSAIVTELT